MFFFFLLGGGGGGRLLTFWALRVGAYSRWVVNRINTINYDHPCGLEAIYQLIILGMFENREICFVSFINTRQDKMIYLAHTDVLV